MKTQRLVISLAMALGLAGVTQPRRKERKVNTSPTRLYVLEQFCRSYKTGSLVVCKQIMLIILLATFFLAPLTAGGEEVTSGVAEVNGTKLYYEMAGQGHPVVLIHGGVLSSSEWDEQFTPLAEHYRVIRYDVRGCGKSETRKLPYSNSKDLYQLLRFLKVEKTAVIGGSMGGGIAVDFTLEHPDMVEALVLVGGVVSGWQYSQEFMQRGSKIFMVAAEEGPEKGADLWLADPNLIPAPENPAARQKFRKLFIENYHGFLTPYYLARTLKPPAIQRLPEIHVPTLIILGQQDIPEVFAIADVLTANIAEAKKTIIPNAGHLSQMEKPLEFNRIVLDFLSGR